MAVVRALCPVLVGRERELTDLEDALLAAMGGEGRMVLLAGDAGMGKTRLATELGERAGGIGAIVLSGGCSEADLALPYLPFLEALGNHVAQVDVKALRQKLGGSASELGNLFPRLGRVPAESGDPIQARLRFFEAILHLLEVIAAENGLLLVVEDLHRADASTRELLDYLARRLLPARVLMLGTYRNEEIGRKHPLLATIQGWRRSGLAEVVELKSLDAAAVTRMVEAILDAPLHADTGDFLYERCEGNPFVLEEFLKESIDRGDIYQTKNGWERKALTEFRLPETVRETILLRLDRLAADQVRMLRAASVLGDSFDDSTLIAVTGQDLPTVREALRACVQQQLVQEHAGTAGSYRFRHALTREAVCDDLVSTERQEYHGRAADALRARPSSSAVDIAQHLFASGRAQEAIPVCLEAARQAQETWALLDAAELYEAALPHVREPLQRAEVLQRLGRCLSYADRRGAASAAERYLQEAVSILDGAGEGVAAARVRVALAHSMYPRLRHAEAERELLLAVEVLVPLGPSADLAEAYNLLSFFKVIQLDGAGCVEWGEKALTAAGAAPVTVAHVRAQNLIGVGLACEGRTNEAIDWLDRSAAEAVRHNWSWYSLSAMHNTFLFLPLERWGEAPARLAGMDSVDSKNFATLICHAWTWVMRGYPAKAAEIAEKARQASARRELAISVYWTNCILVVAYASMGRLDEARSALPPADSTMYKQDLLSRWGAELQLAAAGGSPWRAIADAKPVQNIVSGWPWELERALTLQALVDLGAADEVSADLRLAPDAGFLKAVRIDVARATGDHDFVRAKAPSFIKLADRAGARLFADRARLALAEANAESGKPRAAAALLRAVMASANQREHHVQQERARLLAAKLGVELDEIAPAVIVEEPLATGERFVTVLFADVRGYSAMTQQVAPALMADKIGSLQRSAAREVARHHGTVDKFAGDAVMATFNVSGATVDHASHALRTAVAMRDRARYLGLALGIGIATGPAIVGRLSPGGNVSVLGETTNLAARLQAQAGADEIVLNEEAWRRLREQVDATHEIFELKGFARPIGAYRVHG